MTQRKILVTSALPYANGAIHLGHMVEHIQTDIWVRFQKLRGNECYYCCADDTHGTPVMLAAQKKGIAPEDMIAAVREEHLADLQASILVMTTITAPIRLKTKPFQNPFIAR